MIREPDRIESEILGSLRPISQLRPVDARIGKAVVVLRKSQAELQDIKRRLSEEPDGSVEQNPA